MKVAKDGYLDMEEEDENVQQGRKVFGNWRRMGYLDMVDEVENVQYRVTPRRVWKTRLHTQT